MREIGGSLERTRVQSSSIASIGYDATSAMLEVAFLTGAVYRYHGVPRQVYEAFLAAESHGRYFNDRIRDAYRFTKA